eukprot:TRINITY_DN38482_c0_g1_i1.p1 TRINITY_DN38482_c0_g1~~TRINITY_DN38482_c0_g1_i1.p1  ORF type:complete len:161 (+),score=20.90 TRINITY_DN38482_c0_g1_i1:61-543(+)
MPESLEEMLAKWNAMLPGIHVSVRNCFLHFEDIPAVPEGKKRSKSWSPSNRQSSDAPVSNGQPLLSASPSRQSSSQTSEQDAHQDLQPAEEAGCPFCGMKVHPRAERPGKAKRYQIRCDILAASEVRDVEQRMHQYRQVAETYGVYACNLLNGRAGTQSL